MSVRAAMNFSFTEALEYPYCPREPLILAQGDGDEAGSLIGTSVCQCEDEIRGQRRPTRNSESGEASDGRGGAGTYAGKYQDLRLAET